MAASGTVQGYIKIALEMAQISNDFDLEIVQILNDFFSNKLKTLKFHIRRSLAENEKDPTL